MKKRKSQSVNILETPFSTVTSNGHWFQTTRSAVEKHMPGLLKFYSFEELILKAVAWIDSANSLAMLLYLGLVFIIDPWLATGISIFFHYIWHHYKSRFVNVQLTPVMSLINKDLFQLVMAAVILSYLGISGMHLATALGLLCFFLFKVGLIRMFWDWLQSRNPKKKLMLNDRVLKEILVRYSLYRNLSRKDIINFDRDVQSMASDIDKD